MSVIHPSVCVHDYYKSNEPISPEFGVMIAPTNQKNLLTFGGGPVPDTDSGSLFLFSLHCGIGDGDFRRFISISHTVTHSPADFHDTRRND